MHQPLPAAEPTDRGTCDASTTILTTTQDPATTSYAGPCILRHRHAGPVHQDATGRTWITTTDTCHHCAQPHTAHADLRTAHAHLHEQQQLIHQLADERDVVYHERAHLLAWLGALHPATAVIAPATDITDPGWQILYLIAGGHQMSWHIAPGDAEVVADIPHVPAGHPYARWDGHTTAAKYAAIRDHIRRLWSQTWDQPVTHTITTLPPHT